MNVLTVSNELRFREDLRYALDEETFESVADAPLEWLMECYPNILKYGGSYEHVKRVLDSWRDNSDLLAQSFTKAIYQDHIRQGSFVSRFLYPPAEMIEWEVATQRASDLRHSVSYFIIDISWLEWKRLPDISQGLLALQNRHFATYEVNGASDFTMADYNRLTKFIRENWGQIHPDDDPVLGMIAHPELPVF